MQPYLENQNPFYHLQNAVVGGVARHPAGHTKRNNNLTKQTPKQREFCGFVANRFEHQDYDPSKVHKFRASTCGSKPLPKGGRPQRASNRQGYTRSGQFTAEMTQYGQSRKFRQLPRPRPRVLGQGRQMHLMPEEDELMSKKENR